MPISSTGPMGPLRCPPIPAAMAQRQPSPFRTISDTSTPLADGAKRTTPVTRIVCFAGAGASASFFQGWRDAAGPNTHITAYRPRGRDGRWGAACPSLADSTQDAVQSILMQQDETPDQRLVLFGHSYGALLAYEVAQALSQHAIPLAHLFVAARTAPHMAPRQQLAAGMTHTQLVQALRDLGAKDLQVLSHPGLGPMYLDILRHDLRQNAAYAHCHDQRLSCPITALSGIKDPLAQPLMMANWQACTSGPFFHHRFGGGHFFPLDCPRRLSHLIKSRILSPVTLLPVTEPLA